MFNIIPFFGALTLAAGTIWEKFLLKTRKINVPTFHVIGFLSICLILLPLMFFFWKVDTEAFSPRNLILLFLVIVFSTLANLFAYYSMKNEKISNLEPAKAMEPFFVVLLSIVFSFIFGTAMYQRDLTIVIPALIAGAVLVCSHIRKHHLNFNKAFLAAIAGSFLFGLELIISRLILDFYNPLTFYFFRCAGVLVLGLIFLKPKLNKSSKDGKFLLQMLIIGAIWVVYRFVIYYGYVNLGVVSTTLTIMLGPSLIYFFAWELLKEKLEWRNVIAGLIILACVIYSIVF